MKEFRLPDPGEGLVEAEVVTWRVAVGDEVKINDIVVEIETAKSLVELPIPYAGTVARLLVAEGETVEVGAPIIVVDDGSGDSGEPVSDEDGDADPTGERVANLVGYGPRAGASKRRARRGDEPAAEPPAPDLARAFDGDGPSRPVDAPRPLDRITDTPTGDDLPEPGHASAEPGVATGRLLAKPPVRKLAKDLGVDLATVEPTGEDGVITREDVIAAAQRGTDEPVGPTLGQQAAAWGTPWSAEGDRREPIRGVRKQMAQAMVASAFTAPHVTEWTTIDVTASMELLERLRQRRELREVKITATALAARAVCLALRNHPYLNARWDEGNAEIIHPAGVNLGIAADTPRGLLVPVIKNAHILDLASMAGALNELVATARAGRTAAGDMTGGTFTLTNIGVFGVDAGTPILNPGESGILAMGAISRRPWVVGTGTEERIEPRWVTTMAVSFDHRVVDGATGSRFLAEVAGLLSDPALALLH